MLKRIRKIFYVIVFLVLSVFVLGGIGATIYKERIIDLLKTEINSQLKTRLDVKSIDLKLLKGFPNVSIGFDDVKFFSAFENEILLESKHIYFVLNFVDLFYNEITIERLEIENARIIIHSNLQAENNFDVFVKLDSTGTEVNQLDIKAISFSDVEFVNINEIKEIFDVFNIAHLKGSLNSNASNYQFDVLSEATLNKTNSVYLDWMLGVPISINFRATYQDAKLIFNRSHLVLGKSRFDFSGSLGVGERKNVDLKLYGENLYFENILGFLPKTYQNALNSVRGNGIIEIDANLSGNYGDQIWPSFNSNFYLKEFEVDHSRFIYPIKKIEVDGRIAISKLDNLETGQLDITRFSALINNRKVNLEGKIVNLSNPKLTTTIEGEVDFPWVSSLFLGDSIRVSDYSNGVLELSLKAVIDLSKHEGIKLNNSVFNGEINFTNVSVDSLLEKLNGGVIIDNNEINLSGFTGNYGESDFVIDGTIQKESLSTNNSRNSLKADIKLTSNNINLDQIVESTIKISKQGASIGKNNNMPFSINLLLGVDSIKFRKFRGETFNTMLKIDQNRIEILKATSMGLGGRIAFKGKIVNQVNSDIYIEAYLRTQKIELDSLFYVFNNFSQSFITNSVINGELDSEVYAHMYFDENWTFKRDLLHTEGVFQIKNGELNNFEPIMSLSKYLKNENENLAQLRFSDLKSKVLISNDTVFISDMLIGSNVRNIKIGGYHTLDQHINYRLYVPAIKENQQRDEEFGQIKSDKDGKLYMPFRIKGTTSDYVVNYDLRVASSNFVKGFKKELSEINGSLKGEKKLQKVDSLILDEEEFFDWDNL